jgi:hypothetical protein
MCKSPVPLSPRTFSLQTSNLNQTVSTRRHVLHAPLGQPSQPPPHRPPRDLLPDVAAATRRSARTPTPRSASPDHRPARPRTPPARHHRSPPEPASDSLGPHPTVARPNSARSPRCCWPRLPSSTRLPRHRCPGPTPPRRHCPGCPPRRRRRNEDNIG